MITCENETRLFVDRYTLSVCDTTSTAVELAAVAEAANAEPLTVAAVHDVPLSEYWIYVPEPASAMNARLRARP